MSKTNQKFKNMEKMSGIQKNGPNRNARGQSYYSNKNIV